MSSAIDKDAPADLLKAAYEYLGFDQGALLPATAEPQPSAMHDWIDKGDWQTLAAQVGAEKVFFAIHIHSAMRAECHSGGRTERIQWGALFKACTRGVRNFYLIRSQKEAV